MPADLPARAAPLLLAGGLLTGCTLKSDRPPTPATTVSWVAAGMGHCHALASLPRRSVVAACDRGVVETDTSGHTHILHPTLTQNVSIAAGTLWVKLPDTLLWGSVPQQRTIFASTTRLSLGTVDDMVALPDGRLIVATPGTLVRVAPETGTITRFRKVPVPMEHLALGPRDDTGAPTVLALAKDAIYAVEETQFRMVVGGLTDIQAAVTLSDGRLVVASGRPVTLGVLDGGQFQPTDTTVEGLTDLIVHDPGTGAELWFTTNDGSIGRAPLP